MTTYLGSGDVSRHRTDYRPQWLDSLADDVTMEASVMNGIVTGPAAVRELLAYARTLYDYQEFNFAGAPYARHFRTPAAAAELLGPAAAA